MRAMADLCMLLALCPASVGAGEADVLEAKVELVGARVYRFDVTVRHGDEDGQHYANRWEIAGPDGRVLATRVLRHPHVEEQPFTRSLPRVEIPEGTSRVTIRAHDSVHGWGGAELSVELPQ